MAAAGTALVGGGGAVLEDGAIVTDAVTEDAGPAFTWSLEPPRPNPLRTETTLVYSLAARDRVRVTVYDLAGRRVRGLVDAVLEPDRYQVVWDGRNDRGARLASGIYFVRYEAGDTRIVRRVVRLD